MICYRVLYKYGDGRTGSQIAYIGDTCPIRNIPDILSQSVSKQLLDADPDNYVTEDSLEILDYTQLFCL